MSKILTVGSKFTLNGVVHTVIDVMHSGYLCNTSDGKTVVVDIGE